jgi:hypothetical protein
METILELQVMLKHKMISYKEYISRVRNYYAL